MRMLYKQLEELKPAYSKSFRLVFRHYPLTSIHENALDAARAAEAAGIQGRFWEMHNQLYKNQSKWSKDPKARQIFSEYARSLGLDLARFTRDIDSLQANTRIRQDTERGNSLGVTGTPTVFLNGRELTLDAAEDLPKALNAALAGTGR
ncbi:MAG: DsbA family protein [Pyrinomonadaceae bacterium]